MKASELCIREVAIVTPSTSALEAARLMREQHVGDVIVVEGERGERRPVGVLTDRDLVLDVMAPGDREATATPVSSLLRADVITASEDEDASTVLARMRESGVRRVPIVDARGCLVGVLSHDDLLEWLAEEATALARVAHHQETIERSRLATVPGTRSARPVGATLVREVMTAPAKTIVQTTAVSDAVALLAELDVRHLPVTDSEGELVGMLSDRDLAGQGYRTRTPVASLMSTRPVSVGPDDDLAGAVDLMLEQRVGALAVVDAEDHLVGMLSYVDALRAFQRTLGEARS